MRHRVWAPALAILTACTGEATVAAPPPDAMAPPFLPAIVPDEVTSIGPPDPHFDAYLADLRDLAAKGDRAGLLARLPPSVAKEDWLHGQPLDRRFEIEVLRAEHFPIGTFAVVAIRARGSHGPSATYRQDLLLAHGEARAGLPDAMLETLEATVAALEGEVAIEPRTGWIDATLGVTLAAPATSLFTLDLPSGGLRVAVEQDGRPCRVLLRGPVVVIEPATSGARFTVRYSGGLDGRSPRERVGAARYLSVDAPVWIRRGVPARIALALHAPGDAIAFAPLAREPTPGPYAGWSTRRLEGEADALPLWFAVDAPPMPVWPMPIGGGATLAIRAGVAEHLAARTAFARAAAALAPLGGWPATSMDVLVLPQLGTSEYASGVIAYGPAQAPTVDEEDGPRLRIAWHIKHLPNHFDPVQRADANADLATHELAHWWFGGSLAPSGATSTRWWEALANYVSLWVLDEPIARRRRASWLQEVALLSARYERADLDGVALDAASTATLSYRRGALVFAGLEVRVGRAAMIRWLRALIEARRGLRTTTADVIASIGPVLGAEHEAWVRAWLTASKPATIDLVDVVRDGETLRATLVLDAPVADLRLAVTFARDQLHVAHHVVEVKGARTPIALPIPAGATHLVLASDATLPLRSTGTHTGGLVHALPGTHVSRKHGTFIGIVDADRDDLDDAYELPADVMSEMAAPEDGEVAP